MPACNVAPTPPHSLPNLPTYRCIARVVAAMCTMLSAMTAHQDASFRAHMLSIA